MNEPIISPLLFYWAERIELIRIICCVVGSLMTALVIAIALAAWTDDCEQDDSVKQFIKILVCMALILDTLAVFLPTKTEMFAMYVAEKITPANIEAIGGFTDKTVDALIEKILKASKNIKE